MADTESGDFLGHHIHTFDHHDGQSLSGQGSK